MDLRLALDWTPNINHIGFFVAKEKGFYDKLNIDLEIISPEADNYKYSPAKKIELNLHIWHHMRHKTYHLNPWDA